MNTATEALRLPLGTDLSGFVALLRRLGVPHRVCEEGDDQVLWVPDPRLARAKELQKDTESPDFKQMLSVIQAMHGELERIVIHDLRDHTFYAKLVIRQNGALLEVE